MKWCFTHPSNHIIWYVYTENWDAVLTRTNKCCNQLFPRTHITINNSHHLIAVIAIQQMLNKFFLIQNEADFIHSRYINISTSITRKIEIYVYLNFEMVWELIMLKIWKYSLELFQLRFFLLMLLLHHCSMYNLYI